jgi:hypothetical protein
MGGNKQDQGKLRMDLIPPEIEEALAKVLTHGAVKYGDNNWKEGIDYWRIYGALKRHLIAWRKGELIDAIEDGGSGLPHLYHALAELIFLIYFEEYPEKYSAHNTYKEEPEWEKYNRYGRL